MATKALHLAPGFSLATDFVTKTAAILAQRRKGKTYTASLFAEEFVSAHIPFVALDPTGAWWGLRASADGNSEGLPVVILGGSHGDVPIGRDDGAFVAALVVEHPGYYVIDFSMFESGAAEKEFATDFAKTLYRLKMRPGNDFPLHLFVDEAQRFVPQIVRDRKESDMAMLGAFETLVLRGGLHGIGTTLISQRAAGVNKNVLEQIDVLVCLRIMGPNDIDSVEGYIKRYATAEDRQKFLASLPSLRLGEAWVYEPGGDPPIFEKVQFRERHTFNSSATPRPGERTVQPKKLAPVDIEAIRTHLAETIEKTEADDPDKLRAVIAAQKADLVKLEKELRSERARPTQPTTVETTTVEVEKVVEVEVVPADLADMIRSIDGQTRRLERQLDDVIELSHLARTMSDKATGLVKGLPKKGSTPKRPPKRTTVGTTSRTEPAPKSGSRRSAAPAPRTEVVSADGKLGLAGRRIIAVLLAHSGERTKRQLAMQAGYSAGGGGFNNALSQLRGAGIISLGNPVQLLAVPEGFTPPEGFNAEAIPMSGRDMLNALLNRTGKMKLALAERSILTTLYDHPDGLDKQTLAQITGYEPGGGGFNNALSKLRTLELVEGGGRGDPTLRLVADFFAE